MVTVEDAEAPRRDHQEPDAREENADDADGQDAYIAVKAGGDQIENPRRREHSDEHENTHAERQQRREDASDAACQFFVVVGEKFRVDRDERRREDPLSEQVLQEVGDLQRGLERVRRLRAAEVVGEDAFADETGDPAQQNARRDEHGKAAGAGPWTRLRRRRCRRHRGHIVSGSGASVAAGWR